VSAFVTASGKVHVMGFLRTILVVLWMAAAEALMEEVPMAFMRVLQ